MEGPPAYLTAGCLEIWDVDRKTGDKTAVKALDDGLSWFPDGTRLAYVKLVPRKGRKLSDNEEAIAKSFGGWDAIPTVYVFDYLTRADTPLCAGWLPVVSGDGKSVLVSDFPGWRWRVDVATGRSESVKWPGMGFWAGAPVANPSDDLVLYAGLPTAGTKIEYTKGFGISGPRLMQSLKIAKMNTDQFQTVIPYIDPRHQISFGVVKGGRPK